MSDEVGRVSCARPGQSYKCMVQQSRHLHKNARHGNVKQGMAWHGRQSASNNRQLARTKRQIGRSKRQLAFCQGPWHQGGAPIGR